MVYKRRGVRKLLLIEGRHREVVCQGHTGRVYPTFEVERWYNIRDGQHEMECSWCSLFGDIYESARRVWS